MDWMHEPFGTFDIDFVFNSSSPLAKLAKGDNFLIFLIKKICNIYLREITF
jgi:hypothetical protein